MKKADILITNGIVVTMDADGRQITDGAVAIHGESIAAIGPADEFKDWSVKKTIDAAGGLIMPGLINTHTHAAMSLFRGLADDMPLMTWLNDHIFPAESRLTADMVKTGTRLACAELIRSGTTCFCDMYLFEDAVAEAAHESGMRAVVGEVLFDFPSPNYGPIDQGFAYTSGLLEKWAGNPLVSIAVEPHSPYLYNPQLLQTAAKMASDHSALLIIHLSETHNEVEQIKESYGQTPVGHLADIGILGPNLLACHGVILTEKDIELLAANQVKVSHNAESNMKLASGIAPVPQMLDAGICIGLGTDGCSSNNDLDMFSEMDTVAKLHKVSTLDPTVCNADTILRLATVEGARALGMGEKIGSLERGKLADIIVIDTAQPHLTPMYDAVSHLVYAVKGSDVRHSIIHGRPVMEDRQLLTIDEEHVMAEARNLAAVIAGVDNAVALAN